MSEASFAMLTCACGAERAVKASMANQHWRLAFSRPGFVTAKMDQPNAPLPRGIFIRTASRSIGQSRSEHVAEHVRQIHDDLTQFQADGQRFDELHVWPKDRVPIGKFGFEPGIDEVSRAVADEIFQSLRDDWLTCDAPNRVAEPGSRVLDVVLLEPSHWFYGTHTALDWPGRWPGAVQPVVPQYEPISRAYFKAAEAITWSGFAMQESDLAVEIGSSPGGACGRLLEMGMRVIGIDPADMDPRIANHPRFHHIRARAGDLPRRTFQDAKWLLVDSNVRPEKTLVTVHNIVTHPQCDFHGLLITMKIGDYESSDLIREWRMQIERWDPSSIAVRQLARNKVEVCFAVRMK